MLMLPPTFWLSPNNHVSACLFLYTCRCIGGVARRFMSLTGSLVPSGALTFQVIKFGPCCICFA